MSWTDLTAAQQDSLLRRPFDHFARYRLAAEVIEATVGADARVLDLGGGPGSLQAFLPNARVTSTDIVLPGEWHEQAPSLVLADGAALPFGDGVFDMVVTLDTLEHVVPESRTAFLHEVARVSAGWALVVCPFDTPGVADADTALRAYVASRFAPDLPTIRILDEHLGYGHPVLAESQRLLEQHGPVGVIPSGRIDRWFAGMLAFFHLLAIGDDEPVEVVQRFINRTFYEADLAQPAYRHGLLLRTAASGEDGRSPAELARALMDRAASSTAADADLGVLQVILTESLVASTGQAVQACNDLRQRLDLAEEAQRQTADYSSGLEQARTADQARITELEAGLAAATAELDELRAFAEEVRNHPVARARRAALRVFELVRRDR